MSASLATTVRCTTCPRFAVPLAVVALALTLGASPTLGAALVSNSIYSAFVQDSADGSHFGSWNAMTGAGHPVGANRNLLYNATSGARIQNFSSLRVYDVSTGPTDYTFGAGTVYGSVGGNNLDASLVSQLNVSPSHHRSDWGLAAEGLQITQDVQVVGTTYTDSAIYHTVEISNVGSSTKSLGWRNLYDWTLNDPLFDDGPSNSIESCHGAIVPATPFEFDYTPSGNEFVRVGARPAPAGGATYETLLMLDDHPDFSSYPVTPPSQYTFARWSPARSSAFSYTQSGQNIADGSGDSAGLSWFGHDIGSAIQLAPGESTLIAQLLVVVPPGQCPAVPEPSTAVAALLALASTAAGGMRSREG